MIARTFVILAALSMVSGCIATPRFEMTQKINFDYVTPAPQPMSYADLMCCHRCVA